MNKLIFRLRAWLSGKEWLKAQAVDLQRQLQEAWDERDSLERAYDIVCEQVRREEGNHNYTRSQLHRVARERDGWKEGCQDRHDEIGRYIKQLAKERELRLAAEELREHWEDVYNNTYEKNQLYSRESTRE